VVVITTKFFLESVKHNLIPVTVQQIKRENGGNQPEDYFIFFFGNENTNHHVRTGIFIHKGHTTANKRAEFISKSC
jgi:hypothetical protein